MITLTTPSEVLSVLGGTTRIAYNKFVIAPMNIDPVNKKIDAQVSLTSTAAPEMQPIQGSLRIDLVSGLLTIAVSQLDFYRQVTLTAGQKTAIQNVIDAAQNSLESGLVTLGIIAGTQSAGV